ncbi:MAG: glycosyltransferase [Planctomycetes bacterium]|nr:glycosyltransferase [Planctomycetota bacterium]
MAAPRLSIILSTFDQPRELHMALSAIAAAEVGEGETAEVVVADDGSGPETAAAINGFAERAALAVIHAFQPKEGFRLAAARNLAVRQSRGEILVFIDGDSLVYPRALSLHARRCRPGRAHSGGRCHLSRIETDRLLEGKLERGEAMERAERRERWRRRRRYLSNLFYRATGFKARPKLLGGNCAVHRTDLERVNGFDERFVGWGLEDDDLARRLRRTGVEVRDGTLDCLALHLFHWTHPSHRPSVHHTSNYRYFHRPGFLRRCRHGLKFRVLSEVGFQILGDLPAELAPLLRLLGRPRPGEDPEVLLLAPNHPPAGRLPEAEMVLRLPAPPCPEADPVRHCLDYLERNL